MSDLRIDADDALTDLEPHQFETLLTVLWDEAEAGGADYAQTLYSEIIKHAERLNP